MVTRIFFNQRRKMIKKPFAQLFKDPQKIAKKTKNKKNDLLLTSCWTVSYTHLTLPTKA